MKVLLSKNVAHLGIVGDVVDVKPGYARNYLLPKQLAVEPTENNTRRLAGARKQAEQEMAADRARLEALAAKLEGVQITIRAKANQEGVLYGSVSARDIAVALEAEGFTLSHEQVALGEPIRTLDTFNVEMKLAGDLRPSIKVWVVREKVEGEEDQSPAGEGSGASAENEEATG